MCRWFVEVGMKTPNGVAYPVVEFPSKAHARREYDKRIERENVFLVAMYWREGASEKKYPFLTWRGNVS